MSVEGPDVCVCVYVCFYQVSGNMYRRWMQQQTLFNEGETHIIQSTRNRTDSRARHKHKHKSSAMIATMADKH